MRIVGGEFRGRALATPRTNAIRPTTDRTREAVFNVLAHRFDGAPDGARALDLFAGTGALGIEALSRGAASVVFVEEQRKVAALIHENLRHTDLAAHATHVHLHRSLRHALASIEAGSGLVSPTGTA